MKRVATIAYAVLSVLIMVEGFVFAFFFSWKNGLTAVIICLVGIVFSVFFTPFMHEIGHISFGKMQKMRLKYTKFACFSVFEQNGKLHLRFAPLFGADQTQMVPSQSGNMVRRTVWYTLGGLIFGALQILAFVLLGVFLLPTSAAFFFFGALPYAVYLFMLNVLPVSYASGATDMRVICGIVRHEREELAMILSMDIFGLLGEGKSFSQMQQNRIDNLPIVAEDAPVYAVMQDIKYRYFLETGDEERAVDALNRLALASEYLSEEQTQQIATELLFMHAERGDKERADAAKGIAEDYLSRNLPECKRALAAHYALTGEKDKAVKSAKDGLLALKNESLLGKRRSEEVLLLRLLAKLEK